MKNLLIKLGLLVSLSLSPAISFAQELTVIDFDVVTAVDFGDEITRVIGKEKNTGEDIQINYGSSRRPSERCIPTIMTALEKPGKYFLKVVAIDQGSSSGSGERYLDLTGCRLDIRS